MFIFFRDKYPPLPVLRYTDDILLYSKDGDQENKNSIPSLAEVKQKARKARQERIANGDAASDVTDEPMTDDEQSVNGNSNIPPTEEEKEQQEMIEADSGKEEILRNGENTAELSEDNNEIDNKENIDENNKDLPNDLLSPIPEIIEESNQLIEEDEEEEVKADVTDSDSIGVVNGEINDDDVINEVLGKTNDSAPRSDEDNNILDSILSDEGQNLGNSESNNER